MNIYINPKHILYFIPVIGTIHHARELLKLDYELQKLDKHVPLLKTMSGANTISAQLKNLVARSQLDGSPAIQLRVSKYLADRNKVDQLGFWGSVVQEIVYLAALALNPAFLVLGQIESVHMFYSAYKLASGPDLYELAPKPNPYGYDSRNNISVVFRRDFFGESFFLGKRIVTPIHT